MKLAVFTILLAEYNMEDMAKFLSETGYDGLELRVNDLSEEQKKKPFSFWGNHKNDVGVSNLKEKAKDIRKTCDKYNLEICGLATYVKSDEFDKIEEVCRNLKTLGAKQFRVLVPGYKRDLDYVELFKTTVKNLKKVEKIVSKYKVKALLETHMNMIIPSASSAYRLVSGFDPKNIGIIYDPGNMVYEGFENYMLGLQLVKDYLAHVHVKNAKWTIKETTPEGVNMWEAKPCPPAEGMANLKQFANDLKTIGYNKWLSLEDFSDTPTEEKIVNGYKFMKGLS